MREYGRIKTGFWTDEKILRLSNCGKLLMSYLLTGPHANGIGCFRLPFGYIEADLGWTADAVTAALGELCRENLIARCAQTGWTFIGNYLKHNPIDNPNVAKGAIGQINAVPPTLDFYADFVARLEPYSVRFPKGYVSRLMGATAINPLIGTLPDEWEIGEPESEAKSESEQSGKQGYQLEDIDIEAAMRVWNDLAAELGLAAVQKLTEARKAKLRVRLRDVGGIGGWADVLVKLRDSRFLLGDSKSGWRASFDFVLQESSFNKLKEGVYADKKSDDPAAAPAVFKLPPDIVSKLRSAEFSDTEISRWLDDAEIIDGDGGTHIRVRSNFLKDWIANHFETRLRRAFGNPPQLEVMASSETQQAQP